MKIEDLFQAAGFTPNEQQAQAIAALDGPVYLTAGPGAGKTRVLLWRTLNLIAFHGVRPDEIFLGTFTEKGAHQLREGLRTLLGAASSRIGIPYDISSMAVGTTHSICHQLLGHRKLSENRRRGRVYALLDEFAQYQWVYRKRNWDRLLDVAGLEGNPNLALNRFLSRRPMTSRHEAVRNTISFFNRCSEESIDPAKTRPKDKTAQAVLRMYDEYKKMLVEEEKQPLTDLSLLQQHAFRRLVDSGRAHHLFRHVIVDEYQDTNAIQEKLYFHLANHTGNICVVGDDDQALYRFRGATVDNFLRFPERCASLLKRTPQEIPLVRNYRSRPKIVGTYNEFIKQFSWTDKGRRYRVDKTIVAARVDDAPAVFAAIPGQPAVVANEVADLVARLIAEGRVNDPREIAFLFPSLKTKPVQAMKDALEQRGLQVYAPRAGSFVSTNEAMLVFGLFARIFGVENHVHPEFASWMQRADTVANTALVADKQLARFVEDRASDVREVIEVEQRLLDALKAAGLGADAPYADAAGKALQNAKGLPESARRFLLGHSLSAYLRHQRERRPDRVITNRYVINRASSLDWGVLDLFYQLSSFKAFVRIFDDAQNATDEGPICNLSLVSEYLARFQQDTSPVLAAQFLRDQRFSRSFFASYLYTIFRLGQGEYEDKQDPFPKGRIPFLTIHQAKGLEFPVVVVGQLDRRSFPPSDGDQLISRLAPDKGEPPELRDRFDTARMFYVALSRAKQALILCPYKGPGYRVLPEFSKVLSSSAVQPLASLDVKDVVPGDAHDDVVARPYSFTGDYIGYQICGRRYMIYRKYGFAPSRDQTQVFGDLVHRTIEDLHQFLIHNRGSQSLQATI